MKLNDLRMIGNVYNKIDADTWMTVPRLADTPVTSYLDINDLVLIDPKLTAANEGDNQEVDLLNFFESLNNRP